MRGHLQCENGKGLIGLIHAKNVGFEYFRRDSDGEVIEVIPALKDVSMQVQPGDFVAVLGANGSGKSTFAKHLCALLTPGEGTILVAGMDTADEEKHLQIRQTAGMVFQNPDNQLVAGVVEEDVAFGPENIGVESRQIWQRVEESLQSVGMSAYRYASPMHLSGGQKQRVAIAGIVAMLPKCIVLDEPTAMLDPVGRNEVIDTLHSLNEEKGITIILITHHMNEAIKADRVFVMDKGKLVMQGNPKEVFSHVEKLKSLGLEVPQVTELAYMLKKSGLNIEDGILTVEELMMQINENR